MALMTERLPVEVEVGARGSIGGFHTKIIDLYGGAEVRVRLNSRSKGKWDLSYGIQTATQANDVMDHFLAANGKYNTFRFKDWRFYKIGTVGDASSRQEIGTGNGTKTNFQIVKRAVKGGITYEHIITKIVSGTLSVYVDDVLQTVTTHYTIDNDTGIISFLTAPGSGLSVEVICEFDIHVRFDVDDWVEEVTQDSAAFVPQFRLKEVLAA